MCKSSTSGSLSSAAQSNCQTSGFVGASAPTGNYGLDVNIDVGPFGLSKGGLLSVIQDVFVTPLWNMLVWVVHALIVMLEWCYTLELLGGPATNAIASSLREAQASFTEPWLTLVLAVASMLATYHGLVRRRVLDTLGQVLATIAMMAVGLWVIADPLGSIGAVGRWANQGSLGTLAAVTEGTPANAPRTLADSMRALFAGAIEMPWCYQEFGNVRWCSDPALFDSNLRKAALSLAAAQQAKLACHPGPAHLPCASNTEVPTATIEHVDELLREANTNGELFIAFPANGPERNSVKDTKSLLHVLCQSEDDTKCKGRTAAQAEFRSDSGTFPRMIGIILIAIGVLGMVMLFGLIALHLLAAAVVSLFMLLLAPFAVLAPALGEAGRAVFGGWLVRLLGAITSKLLFSFLFGVLLTMQRILMSLQPLGWWTQWLLISSFWWAVFLKRHQAQAFMQSRGRAPLARNHRAIGQRIQGPTGAQRTMRRPLRWAKGKMLPPVPFGEQLRKRAATGRNTRSKRTTWQKTRHPERPPAPRVREKSKAHVLKQTELKQTELKQTQLKQTELKQTQLKQTQLERVRTARDAALAHGERRRAAKLAVRERRIEAELAHGPRQRPKRIQKIDRPLGPQMHTSADVAPRPLPANTVSDPRARNPQGVPEQKSEVMDDARAVEERRKRQLGYGPKP